MILIGLQASGKSSFVRSRFAATHVHVGKDLLGAGRHRARRQLELIQEALDAGRSVVVDDTNPRVEDRAPVIALGGRHRARVVAYWFDASLSECLMRNAERPDRARVPAALLYTTARRLQPPDPREGFDALYRVRFVDDRFVISPVAGEVAPPSQAPA